MKKIIGRIIFIIAIVGVAFSGYRLYLVWKDYNVNETLYTDLSSFSPKTPSGNLKVDSDLYWFKDVDFDNLYNINNDFVGWITIPDTMINYPLVKPSVESDDYYLYNNFNKEKNSGGALFVESHIKNPFEDENTIIHGHNMRNGSMFADLNKYKEKDFFDSNKRIYISTKNVCYVYEVFSVYVEKANDMPYEYSFASKDEYTKYLNKLKDKTMFKNQDIDNFTENDKIITLSTCSYEVTDGRCLVHAKLIKRKEK